MAIADRVFAEECNGAATQIGPSFGHRIAFVSECKLLFSKTDTTFCRPLFRPDVGAGDLALGVEGEINSGFEAAFKGGAVDAAFGAVGVFGG